MKNRAQTLTGWRAACALLLLLVPEIAHVGQLHIKNIELGELLRRSTHIVVAVPDDPPEVEEQVAIKATRKKVPPYVRLVHRYRVVASLRGDLAPDAAVAVAPADDALHERLHRDYYTQGLSRHVAVDRYEPRGRVTDDAPRILFLNTRGGRLAYAVEGGMEGLGLRSEIERLIGLKSGGVGESREARVDRALRQHGDFGVYGDLRAGLQELRKDFRVTLNEVENGIAVSAVPRSGRGHEFFFVVNTDGTINPPMVGESEPVIPRPPQLLVFRFNHLRLAKQGDTISLTMDPVWQDAQRAPPPDFELGKRVLRMNAVDFQRFWAELYVMDFAYYAQVTDADFETTPPDLRHTEQLTYAVNGKEIVSWGRDYQWLRAGLRAPLLDIQQQLTAWADEQPAPAPGSFVRVMLRDVEGLNGGQNVYVYSDGKVVVQRVLPAQGSGGLQERRYEWKLDARQITELKKILAQHPPRAMGLSRPGIPGEVQVEIDVIGETGMRTTMHQWADDAQADFAALHSHLLRYTRATEKLKPVHEGKYDPDWRPEEG